MFAALKAEALNGSGSTWPADRETAPPLTIRGRVNSGAPTDSTGAPRPPHNLPTIEAGRRVVRERPRDCP